MKTLEMKNGHEVKEGAELGSMRAPLGPRARSQTRKLLGVVSLLLCSIPGLLMVAFAPPVILGGDGSWYHRLAVNILRHHAFSLAVKAPYQATLFRTPGYPVFLAAIYWLTHDSIVAVMATQLLLLWFSAWLVAQICRHIFSRSVAFVGACLTLVYLPLVSYVPYHLTEILSCFLLALASLLFLKLGTKNSRSALICGTVFSLLALTRPFYLLLPFLLSPVLLWRNSSDRSRATRCAVLLLVGSTAPVATWVARNWFLSKKPVLTSGVGVVLYEGALQYAGKYSYRLMPAEWDRLIAEERRQANEVRMENEKQSSSGIPSNVRYELALNQHFKSAATEVFRKDGVPHPLENIAKHVAYLWSSGDFSPGWVHRLARIEHYLFLSLIVIGVWLLKAKRRLLVTLLLPAAYTTVFLLPFHIEARFSIPARLPMMPIAAYALCEIAAYLLRCLKGRRAPQVHMAEAR